MAAPCQILADNNDNFVIGDQYGIWIADANTGIGAPIIFRYSLDSGRWLAIPLANNATLSSNRCMASDEVGKLLYVLQYQSGATYLTVIDTHPLGDPTFGVTAVNGIVDTFMLTDQLGGTLSAPAGLVFEPTTGTLWTATGSNSNNQSGFYRIDPTTGDTTFFDVSSFTFGFGPVDIFAAGGFLYQTTGLGQAIVYQFDATNVNHTGQQNVFDGGANTGQVSSFDVDPTTGNILCVPSGGDTTIFSTIRGYVVFAPSSMAVVSAASGNNNAAKFDSSGNIWVFGWPSQSIVCTSLGITKSTPSNFGQADLYGVAWVPHINGNPNLLMVDDGTGGGIGGTLYAGNDTVDFSFFNMGNTTDAPVTSHITPGALVAESNAAYPTNDQNGLWISSGSKVARYAPARVDTSAFFIVPLADNTFIPVNGIASDPSNLRAYALDQTNSAVWEIDTNPITDGGGHLIGVNGVLRYIDLTSQWAAGSATFGGLAIDTTTTGDLFIADGTSTSYRVTTSGVSITITQGSLTNPGATVYSAAGSVLYTLSDFLYGADLVDPTSLSVTTQFAINQVAAGVSANGTSYFVADQAGNVDVLAVDGSSQSSFFPEVSYFPGDSVILHGSAAGTGGTVWIALEDQTLSTNFIINFPPDGSVINSIKVLQAPFVFPSAGSYGQGTYGYAWIDSLSEVFVSDSQNQQLLSGDTSNNPMNVETLFPYSGSSGVNVSSDIESDSTVVSDLSGTPPILDASITADSSVMAAFAADVDFNGDSDLTADLSGGTAPTMVDSAILADSSLGGFMTFQGALNTGILADSSILADLEVVLVTVAIIADSSVAGSAQVLAGITSAHLQGSASLTADVSVNFLIPTDLLADSHLYVQLNVFNRTTPEHGPSAPPVDRSIPPMVRHILRVKKEKT